MQGLSGSTPADIGLLYLHVSAALRQQKFGKFPCPSPRPNPGPATGMSIFKKFKPRQSCLSELESPCNLLAPAIRQDFLSFSFYSLLNLLGAFCSKKCKWRKILDLQYVRQLGCLFTSGNTKRNRYRWMLWRKSIHKVSLHLTCTFSCVHGYCWSIVLHVLDLCCVE